MAEVVILECSTEPGKCCSLDHSKNATLKIKKINAVAFAPIFVYKNLNFALPFHQKEKYPKLIRAKQL
jgi:hypothetical protein